MSHRLMRRSCCWGLAPVLLLVACGTESSGPGVDTPPDSVPPAAAAWLRSVAFPLTNIDLRSSLDDLEPLRAMVGDARVVALGEATHGTREFFLMKGRILRFLVERMGFDAFAIEATWPEANRLDHYVRTGEGDPAQLLSGLYFWTWNTEEVLAMIEWMREYNAAGGSVGFYGFDMQFPGMAIHNVLSFVERTDADALLEFSTLLRCLEIFGNDARGGFPPARYQTQPLALRDACHADLTAAHDTLAARRAMYEAASSPAEFASALQSARVAIQYEEVSSGRRSRDAAMAENSIWLLDQLGPDARIVLWAHNFHISTQPQAMGLDLRAHYAQDYVTLGFSFATGTFTAVTQGGSSFFGRSEHSAPPLLRESYEQFFSAARQPRFLLDLRGRSTASDSSAWLAGPRLLRSIGCCYDPNAPERYWYSSRLPQEFDLLVHFEATTSSRVLTYQPPGEF
jgi:erythromycin esterase